MLFDLNFEKFRGFSKECKIARRAVMMSMRLFLLSIVCLAFLTESSQAGGSSKVTIGGETVVSCDGGVAGAVLRADVDRVLSSVVILMDDAPAPFGGFSISLYNEAEEGARPGEHLAELKGPDNPSTAGKYTYTSERKVILEASENYWVVATVQKANSAYCFQAVKAEAGEATNVLGESFVRLGDESQALVSAPAIFASFDSENGASPTTGSERFKLLWTLLLSGVILICCIDLLPLGRFGRFAPSR